MTGIRYLTDEQGRKAAVLISLNNHGALWEDIKDGLVPAPRRKETSIHYQPNRASRQKRPECSRVFWPLVSSFPSVPAFSAGCGQHEARIFRALGGRL